MRSFIAALSFAASALAYSISQPSASQGWTTLGPNTVVWERVNTDALNFTILLVNQDASILPSKSEVLSAFVDGSAGRLTVSPPSGGFPVGTGFQVNLVQDPDHTSTILAQSNQFEIKASPASASASATHVTQTAPSTGAVTTAPATGGTSGSATDSGAGDLNPTNSLTDTSPAGANAAGRLSFNAVGGATLLLAALSALLL